MAFNTRPRDSTVPGRIPPANAPLDVTAEDYKARLWRETDASLRQDPTRWVTASATGSHRDGNGELRGRVYTERFRPSPDGERESDHPASNRGRKSWETRRAREAARAAAQQEES